MTKAHAIRARLPLLVLMTTLFAAGLLTSRLIMTPAHVHRAPELEAGTVLQPPRPLPDFELTGDDGRKLTRDDLTGSWTLVFMGFTNCGDVCPTTLYTLNEVAKQLSLAPQVLFVSVDPARDTPAVIHSYIDTFNAQWLGASGTPAELDKLAGRFGAHWRVSNEPDHPYVVEHSNAVFLLDPATRFHALFSAPLDADAMADDLSRLMGG